MTTTPREALDEIIKANGLTFKDAARDIGTTALQLRRWRERDVEPCRAMREKIAVWSEGRIPADARWNEPMEVAIPGALPEPEAMLCWTEPPQGVGIERLREELCLPNLVGWRHIAARINVTTSAEVTAHFRALGFLIISEPRRLSEHTIMVSVPCTPLLPYMNAT